MKQWRFLAFMSELQLRFLLGAKWPKLGLHRGYARADGAKVDIADSGKMRE